MTPYGAIKICMCSNLKAVNNQVTFSENSRNSQLDCTVTEQMNFVWLNFVRYNLALEGF